MTVKELIEALSSMDEDATIRIAGQPSYPMEAEFIGLGGQVSAGSPDGDDECADCMDRRSDHVAQSCTLKDLDDDTPCPCEGFEEPAKDDESGVWLVVGDNIGYGVPREVYDTARYGW